MYPAIGFQLFDQILLFRVVIEPAEDVLSFQRHNPNGTPRGSVRPLLG